MPSLEVVSVSFQIRLLNTCVGVSGAVMRCFWPSNVNPIDPPHGWNCTTSHHDSTPNSRSDPSRSETEGDALVPWLAVVGGVTIGASGGGWAGGSVECAPRAAARASIAIAAECRQRAIIWS